MSVVDKKVRMKLVGLNGNAFSLLGAFASNAREQGWTPDEIKAVRDEAMSGDYDHLLRTLIDHTTQRAAVRKGFTLIELMVVMAIGSIVLAAMAPFVPRWWADWWISRGAQNVQGALVEARSAAANRGVGSSPVVGVRFLPDPQWDLVKLPDGTIDRTRPIAYARTVPLVEVADYAVGRVSVHTDGWPSGFTPAYGRLVLEQSPVGPDGYPAEPTNWWWQIRVGDVLTLRGRDYTVCGPTLVPTGPDNAEGFVNWGWPGATASPLDRGAGPMEWLYLTNRTDDDRDGLTDEGFDGLDQDLDGLTDEPDEWEVERWCNIPYEGVTAEPYTIRRRPIALDVRSGGEVANKKLQASPVVVDGLRSILPVNPFTGAVDVVFGREGEPSSPSAYGRPATLPMGVNKLCLWVDSRPDVTEPPSPDRPARLVTLDMRSGVVRVVDADPTDVAGTLVREEGR